MVSRDKATKSARRPPPIIDEPDALVVTTGGLKSMPNLSGPAVVSRTPGRLNRLIVIASGTAGAFTLNDAASIDAAGAGNTIFALPSSGTTICTAICLDWPCASGIVLSALPDGGILAVSYT